MEIHSGRSVRGVRSDEGNDNDYHDCFAAISGRYLTYTASVNTRE